MSTNRINKVVVNNQTLVDLTKTTLTPIDVPESKSFFMGNGALVAGTQGQDARIKDLLITLNGEYNASEDEDEIDGYSPVTANVELDPIKEAKVVAPTRYEQIINPSEGRVLGQVVVEKIPEEYIVPTGVKTIEENGENIDVTEFSTARVFVQPKTDILEVNIPTNGTREYDVPEGIDGYNKVIVNVNTESELSLEELTVDQNNVELIPTDCDGYSKVKVSIPAEEITIEPSGETQIINEDKEKIYGPIIVKEAPLETITVSPGEYTQNIVPNEGYYGLSSVTVTPIPLEEGKFIETNGIHFAESGKYFKSVTVKLPNPVPVEDGKSLVDLLQGPDIEVGNVFKYIGETGYYEGIYLEQGELYIVEVGDEEEETL